MVDLREKIRSLTIRVGGRDPFTGEVWSARSFPGYELRSNQEWKQFSLVMSDTPSFAPWVRAPLAVGETASLIDASTGLAMPFAITAGQAWRSMSDFWSFNRLAKTELFIDTVFTGGARPETLGTFYYDILTPLDTLLIDPTAALPHILDQQMQNIDDDPLHGFWIQMAIVTLVGTPPFSDTKIVRCKHCGEEESVPAETTLHKCKECEKMNWYYPAMRGPRGGT